MPAMIRPKGKPTKIAFSILGVPANMREHKTPKKKKQDKELLLQETVRIR